MHDAIDDTQKQNIEYFNEFTLLNNGIFSGLKDDLQCLKLKENIKVNDTITKC